MIHLKFPMKSILFLATLLILDLQSVSGFNFNTFVLAGIFHEMKMAAEDNQCLRDMGAAELSMIQRLAGNDPTVRKATFKKLKKWLKVLANKLPDTPECRETAELKFIRVWKALFYCMWMADKPLPQEQLAEQISDLIGIFSAKPNVMLLFIEWFFRTVAREWPYMDKFRTDKFMMLVRRFLRKALLSISKHKWNATVLEGFSKIIANHIFNRHPNFTAKKSKLIPGASPIQTTVGFQIHVADIFLEEVAKTSGVQNVHFKKILKILAPFIYELAWNSDDRILKLIQERVFHHLMRQSDVGIEYFESLSGNGQIDEDEESDDESEQEEQESESDIEEINNNSTNSSNNEPLDPRAGAVDVFLPQLPMDYKVLSEKLTEIGGTTTIKRKNRTILYTLARQFKKLDSGTYPLALDIETSNKPAINRREVKRAAKRLLEFDEEIHTDSIRRTGQKNKRSKRKHRNAEEHHFENSNDSIGSEDNSTYLHDDDMLDHVSDNYLSYLEEEVKKQRSSPRKNGTPISLHKKLSPTIAHSPRALKMTDSQKIKTPLVVNGSPAAKKRVSFVLARNLEHDFDYYAQSINKSPAVPYDAKRKPFTAGRLKVDEKNNIN